MTSGLYRYHKGRFERWECFSEIEKERILESDDNFNKEFLSERFSDVQHLGRATNWIDFTSNPCVALFFACFVESSLEKNRQPSYLENGRVIIAKESGFARIAKPCSQYVNPSQSSVLVHPKNSGVIDIANTPQIKVVCVPREEKVNILMELANRYGISIDLLFTDDRIHGYIRSQSRFLSHIVYEEIGEDEREGLVLEPVAEGFCVWKARMKPLPRISIWFMPEDVEERQKEWWHELGWHEVVYDEPLSTDDLPNFSKPDPSVAVNKPSMPLDPPIAGSMIISKNQRGSVYYDLCQAYKERRHVYVKQGRYWEDGMVREKIFRGRITNISSRKVTFSFDYVMKMEYL